MTATDSVELEWGIRRSFVAYVERLPDGVVTATGGAVHDAGAFHLPGRRMSSNAWSFDGAIHFAGYSGVLDVTLQKIQVHGGVLSAEVAGSRIPMALLARSYDGFDADPDEGALRFDDVVFTDDGAAVLGGVYSANAPADSVTIRPTGDPAHHTLSAPVRTP